ncbi:MAG: pyridoxamine 5'-phosphate oxidase family protein [Thermodesulfobacteriota bacterium]|nr:pyridoxamine 5'-phosphate oxidase family protein [Thermodesulfobacteriota bacterium]
MNDLSEIQELFSHQNLAVLATHQDGEPHTFLVAFAEAEGLRHMLFATYRQIRKSPIVALLVDNRSNRPSDFQKGLAVTGKGSAHEVGGSERVRFATLYLKKHPALREFVESKETALIRVDIEEYKVAGFQAVKTLRPA